MRQRRRRMQIEDRIEFHFHFTSNDNFSETTCVGRWAQMQKILPQFISNVSTLPNGFPHDSEEISLWMTDPDFWLCERKPIGCPTNSSRTYEMDIDYRKYCCSAPLFETNSTAECVLEWRKEWWCRETTTQKLLNLLPIMMMMESEMVASARIAVCWTRNTQFIQKFMNECPAHKLCSCNVQCGDGRIASEFHFFRCAASHLAVTMRPRDRHTHSA